MARARSPLEAIRRAGMDLTREKFIDALETIKNFDTGVTFPITYSQDNHEATDQVSDHPGRTTSSCGSVHPEPN